MDTFINRGIKAVQTAADGTQWVQLSPVALPCNQLVIFNESGTALRWRYCALDGTVPANGDTADLPIADGTGVPVQGIQDARQVQVKRTDNDNTQVTVRFLHHGA